MPSGWRVTDTLVSDRRQAVTPCELNVAEAAALTKVRVVLRQSLHQLSGRGPKVARVAAFHADLQAMREDTLALDIAVAALGRKRHRVVTLKLAPVRRHCDTKEIAAVEGLILGPTAVPLGRSGPTDSQCRGWSGGSRRSPRSASPARSSAPAPCARDVTGPA